MKRVQKWIVMLAAVFLLMNGAHDSTWADHHGNKERNRHGESSDRDDDNDHGIEHRGGSDHDAEGDFSAVDNPTYREHCGACHLAYQPELLPSGSWEKILTGVDDHFGEVVEVDADSKNVIARYLKSNGAENSSAERAVKIMRSLGKEMPLRITEIPYT